MPKSISGNSSSSANENALPTEILTYTPVIQDGSDNAYTSTGNGYYYQIGRTVYVSAYIQWTNRGSASGAVSITLPVAASSLTNSRGVGGNIICDGIVVTSTNLRQLTCRLLPGANTAGIVILGLGNGSISNITAGLMDASGVLELNIQYLV